LIFPGSLVKGLTIGAEDFDRHGREVEQLLAWVAEKGEKDRSKRFEISREDAAAVLESGAGRKTGTDGVIAPARKAIAAANAREWRR
jgi:hypothetical protein